MSLQYFNKKVIDEVGFSYPDKYENFLQVDAIVFWWVWAGIAKEPKQVYNIFAISQERS